MHSDDFATRIAARIQERDLAPRPKWEFALRNLLILVLLGFSILFGAFTVATAEFLLTDRDWDIYLQLGHRNTIATLQSLPYLWLAALVLLVWMTYELLSRTRRGYRFMPLTLLGGSVVSSVVLGSALYAAGFGPVSHRYLEKRIPGYDAVVISRDYFWMNPRQGLLGGFVTHVTSSQLFDLRDVSGRMWVISGSADDDDVYPDAHIRVLGAQTGTSTFSADMILPWTPGDVFVGSSTVKE